MSTYEIVKRGTPPVYALRMKRWGFWWYRGYDCFYPWATDCCWGTREYVESMLTDYQRRDELKAAPIEPV